MYSIVVNEYLTIGTMVSIVALYYRASRNRADDRKAIESDLRKRDRQMSERLLSLEKGAELSHAKEEIESFRNDLKDINKAISELGQSIARIEGVLSHALPEASKH